jgi:hypothetical protein
MYRRQGGKWSDSFEATQFVQPTGAKLSDDIASLVNILQSTEMEGTKYTEYQVVDNYADELGYDDEDEDYEQTFFDKGEAEEYILQLNYNDRIGYQQEQLEDQYRYDLKQKAKEENKYEGKDKYEIEDLIEEEIEKMPPRFVIEEKNIDTMGTLQTEAANKLLEKPKGSLDNNILQLLKNRAIENGKLSLFGMDMIKKYPELFSKEEIEQVSHYTIPQIIKNMPSEQAQKYKKEYADRAISKLDSPKSLLPEGFTGPTKSVFGLREYIPDLYINFDKQISTPIKEYADQLQEGTIQKLVNLPLALEEAGIPQDNRELQNIKQDIASIFFLKGSDTPTVQKYLGDMLSSTYESDKYHIFRYIAGLGENGTQFLPQLREELESLKEQYKIKKPKNPNNIDILTKRLESILFCIDAIESGTGKSTKYKFHW